MKPLNRLRDTRGMTLVEMMVATVIVLVVLTISLGFFNSQSVALKAGTGQLALTQNYRLALTTLASQVRSAGTNTAAGQPFLVYAGPDAIAFNADFVSDDPNELFAVSVDTAALPSEAYALQKTDRFTLPGTSFTYPDTSYKVGPANSGAETIVFYFESDATTSRGDDFVLYRQVNRAAPAVVARNILRTSGIPFFQYIYPKDNANATQSMELFSNVTLTHSRPVHGKQNGAQPDTGTAAQIDLIRGVRVNLTATDGVVGSKERKRSVSRTIALPNAGMALLESCGEVPQLGTSITATPSLFGQPPTVTLRWNSATDERAGEQDVLRYLVWKKLRTDAQWGPPFLSISSGLTSYVFADTQVEAGKLYDYALSAQDCTPSMSPQATTSAQLP